MNGWIGASAGLSLGAVGLLAAAGDAPAWLVYGFLAFALLQVVGALLVMGGTRRGGAILAMVGAAAFVPLGFVGLWGGRKVLDELAREDFERRRRGS